MKKSISLFLTATLLMISCSKNQVKKEDITEKENVSTKSENVQILEKEFSVVNQKGEAISRKIWLYLPPNYRASNENYPVIYMHDGQNVFDAKTSYAGEWKVDELLNTLFEETGKGFIVVAINNDGKERLNEYSPWIHTKYGGGSGDAYIQMIRNELKPYIDANYQTKPGAEFTGIIGSSMGGLISYYAGLEYPETFGKIGVISPSFWFSDEILSFTESKISKAKNSRFYFLLGSEEGMTKEFEAVIGQIHKSNFSKSNYKDTIIDGGKHNEAFWSTHFVETITFLYNF